MSARFTRRNFAACVGLGAAGLLSQSWWALADDGPSDGELDAFVRTRMDSAHVPGLSLAIIRDGKLRRVTGFGFADLAQPRPMSADTLMNIASVTKTITCIAVMQLWEQKKFALDGDVNAHLPFPVRHFAYPEVPLTFRQLLTHTSSIADGPAYDQSYACGDSRVPLGQWLRDYFTAGGALYDPQRNFHSWKPGARFGYSNVAYGLLGHLVETLSGISYSDYMLHRVFAPLRMSHTRILLAGMDPQSHATPYTYVKDGNVSPVGLRDQAATPPADPNGGAQVPHCLYSWGTPPDGLVRTSAAELSRVLLAFMNGGKLEGQRVLQSRTIAQILTDQHVAFAATPPTPQGQGLAWHWSRGPGPSTVWGHSGGDPGISTLVALRPTDGRGVVILMNSDGAAMTAADIAQRVLAE